MYMHVQRQCSESIQSSSAGPLQPSNLISTDITHNTATIFWTVSRIAYTPETYTVHFGTSSGSLTNVSQQRQSGDNFTATNLPFSIELTGLAAGTTYYYQVVAMNSVGTTATVEQSFTTTELCKLVQIIPKYLMDLSVYIYMIYIKEILLLA